MDYYSYKLVRDYGFAPNPFGGFCSLATCKPGIRRKAEIGDWVIGTGGKTQGWNNRLIYLMKVEEKLTYQQYWDDKRFNFKKPVMNGGLVKIHGDNIYTKAQDGIWMQANSQHSFATKINEDNLKRDLSGEFVLVSKYFFYFGGHLVKVPKEFSQIPNRGRNIKKLRNLESAKEFILWVEQNFRVGFLYGNPINWRHYAQLKMQLL